MEVLQSTSVAVIDLFGKEVKELDADDTALIGGWLEVLFTRAGQTDKHGRRKSFLINPSLLRTPHASILVQQIKEMVLFLTENGPEQVFQVQQRQRALT